MRKNNYFEKPFKIIRKLLSLFEKVLLNFKSMQLITFKLTESLLNIACDSY